MKLGKKKEKKPLTYHGYSVRKMEDLIQALEGLENDDTILTETEGQAVRLAVLALSNIQANLVTMENA